MDLKPTSRFSKIFDALSQLANVALLPNHADTTSNESISGRCWRNRKVGRGWSRAMKAIDTVLFWDTHNPDNDGPAWGHCRLAHYRDYLRARAEYTDHRDAYERIINAYD